MEHKKDQSKLNPHELDYGPAAETRVNSELASFEEGQLLVNLANVKKCDPRTRLVLLLNSLSGRRRIDWQVFQYLTDEFYYSLNGYIGGLTRDAYAHFAYQCQPVIEAALYHREHFVPANGRGQK